LFFYLTYAIFLAAFRKKVTMACILTITSISVILIPVPGITGVLVENRLFLEFVFGLLLVEWWKSNNSIDQNIGIPCILVSFLIFTINYKLNGIDRVLAWGVPSLLLIIGALSFERLRILQHSFFIILGDSSYTMYLFHITIIEFILQTFVRNGLQVSSINNYKISFIIFLSSSVIISSIVINKFIEKPALRFLRNLLLPERSKKSSAFDVKEASKQIESSSVICTPYESDRPIHMAEQISHDSVDREYLTQDSPLC
jgi:exopolysaccharide production protein ExoZ